MFSIYDLELFDQRLMVEIPKRKVHGDFSTSFAMILSKKLSLILMIKLQKNLHYL